MFTGFGKGVLPFFLDLRFHNSKEFMDANRERYQKEVRAPFYAFIETIGPQMQLIDPDFEIRPFPSQRLRLRTTVLNYLDSNQERQNQNLLCYHYTIVQSDARKQVQRYGKESKFQKKSSANGKPAKNFHEKSEK